MTERHITPTFTPFNTGDVRGVNISYPGTEGFHPSMEYFPDLIVDLATAYNNGWLTRIGSIEMWADHNFHWFLRERNSTLNKVYPQGHISILTFPTTSRQIRLTALTIQGTYAYADRFDMTIYEQILPSYSSPTITTP